MNRLFILNNGLHGSYYAVLQSDSVDYRKLHLTYYVIYLGSDKPEQIEDFCKETDNLEKQARKYINNINAKDKESFVLWSY